MVSDWMMRATPRLGRCARFHPRFMYPLGATMRVLGLASILLLPAAALAQGTFPGMAGHYAPNAPKLPWVELSGPLDTALARVLLKLSDDQATARGARVRARCPR